MINNSKQINKVDLGKKNGKRGVLKFVEDVERKNEED